MNKLTDGLAVLHSGLAVYSIRVSVLTKLDHYKCPLKALLEQRISLGAGIGGSKGVRTYSSFRATTFHMDRILSVLKGDYSKYMAMEDILYTLC